MLILGCHPQHQQTQTQRLLLRPGDEEIDPEVLPAPVGKAPFPVDAVLTKHLRQEHQLTPSEYRSQILGRALAEWPTQIPAQVVRTRLLAYKQSM